MLQLMRRWQVLVLLAATTVVTNSERDKRQLSIDDLISRALSLVRPIFDTSQPLQYDEMLRKQPIPSTDDLRESSILGSHSPTPLDDIPLCKGSNRICQFISCSAENFKKDPTFGNLQLAAQVLSDKKLRQAISRFITTIESKTPRNEESSSRHADSITPPSRKENDILMDDADYDNGDMPTPIERRKALGSKTWSSQPDQGPQLFEIRNDLVASLTPLPPAPFHPPTPPPAPPLAFPIVPSLIVPPMPAPILSIDKLLQMDTIRRQRRDIDWDIVDLEPDIMMTRRVKRDYYDEAKDSGSSGSSSSSSSTPSSPSSPDYYGSVAESSPPRHREESTPLQNCVHILGIY